MHCKWPIKELTKNDLLLITPTRNLQQKTVTMKTNCRILPPKAYTYKVVKGKVSLKLTFQRAWGKMSEILFKTYLQTWYHVHADLTKLLWSQKKKKNQTTSNLNMYELLRILKGSFTCTWFLVLYLYLISLVMSTYWHPIWQKQMLHWVIGGTLWSVSFW